MEHRRFTRSKRPFDITTCGTLAALLKQLRSGWCMTQEDLALELNCSVSLVGHLERSIRLPSPEMAVRLADIFGYLRLAPHELWRFMSLALDSDRLALLPSEKVEDVPPDELQLRLDVLMRRWKRHAA